MRFIHALVPQAARDDVEAVLADENVAGDLHEEWLTSTVRRPRAR